MPDKVTATHRQCAVCERWYTYLSDRPNSDPRRYCSPECRRIGAHRHRRIDVPCCICQNIIIMGPVKAARVKNPVCSHACAMRLRYPDVKARLLANLDRSGECWLWLGNVNKQTGYAAIRDNGKRESIHRVSYRLFIGPIPDGLEIDHLCHNADPSCADDPCFHRRCANPSHLEAVTHQVNALRGKGICARNARRTAALQEQVAI